MSGAPASVRPSRRDHALGAALSGAYVAVLLATAPDLGLSRDESFYVDAASSYSDWLRALATDPGAALERAAIDRRFSVNHEHPALPKLLFALGHLVDEGLGIFPEPSSAYRFVGMLSGGLLLWLVYVFGVRLFGRPAGLFAALAYALLPRPFYHAHLCAFDVPVTLAMTATTYAYWRSLYERRWALWTGVLFGLALSTKHNSWMLPGVFLVHFAICSALDRGARRRGATSELVHRADWLLAMLVVGPLVFLAFWPWMWHDTLARLGAYLRFHLRHEYYNIAYFGVNYFWPPFPVSYPWVMTLYTVPVTTLLLALAGMTTELRHAWRTVRARLGGTLGSAEAVFDPRQSSLLMVGALFAPLAAVALPSTPIFGGTKHWMSAYPFLALFAGAGFARALGVYRRTFAPAVTRGHRLVAWAGALLLAPAAVETTHAHPFALSHYGFAAGFVPGSADRGMNRQFWGFTTRSLAGFFAKHLPRGGRVWVCDTTPGAFRMLASDGLLPRSIVATGELVSADYAIVHHEHHFAEVDHQIWSAWGTTRPAYVLDYDGVPIISVYENPARTLGR